MPDNCEHQIGGYADAFLCVHVHVRVTVLSGPCFRDFMLLYRNRENTEIIVRTAIASILLNKTTYSFHIESNRNGRAPYP